MKAGCVYRHNTFPIGFSTPWMELVAKCIRQERTVELWMQFRAARAARDAREPYRAARAARESGSRPRGTIERSAPRGSRVPKLAYKPTRGDFRSRPTRLAWRANYSARVLAYAHDYPISPRPSLGIPGTPASCWGRRESHLGTIVVCAPLSKQLCCAALYLFLRIENSRYPCF